jgi:hypothetical protein
VYGLCALAFAALTGFTFLEMQQPSVTSTETATSATSIDPKNQQTAKNSNSTSSKPSGVNPASGSKDERAASSDAK